MKNAFALVGLLATLAGAAPHNTDTTDTTEHGGHDTTNSAPTEQCHTPWKRFGAPGMGSFYNHDWDHPGYKWGGSHESGSTEPEHPANTPCPDPNSVEETAQGILDHPTVEVNETIPVTSDNATVEDMVDSETVPSVNITVPILGDGELPALMNGSDATGFGGVTSEGMSETVRPPQGTNENVMFDSSTGTSGMMSRRSWSPHAEKRALADARKRQVNAGSQPEPPAQKGEAEEPNPDKRCAYGEYKSVLGGDGSEPLGALWALEGYVDLVASDVQQGAVGNCGLGASVMALASGGWTRYLKNNFRRIGDTEGNYEVTFYKDGITQRIAIDDKLPVRTAGSSSWCWPYPGYQPVNDAAKQAPDGTYPPTPIFFMPLFEKAFAKFLDANSDWKSTPREVMGYLGTEGINPAYALAAITGGTPKSVYRDKPGMDVDILVALVGCMTNNAPCVIGTTNATTLQGLGTPDTYQTIWLNPGGDDARGYTPGDTAGMASSDSPKSNSTYTVIDFDQVVKTEKGDRSTVVTLVGTHAYAFDASSSTDWPLQTAVNSIIEARMSILNPWGSNPCSWPGGGCGKDGGIYPMPSKLPLSLRTLAQSIYSVYTVENMMSL